MLYLELISLEATVHHCRRCVILYFVHDDAREK